MSYSSPDKLAARIGPRIYAGLTVDTGTEPDKEITQGALDAAALEINVKVGTRYTVPITAPPAQVAILAGLEEQIALWFLYVRRGIGEQETAASAAKVGYDNAFKTLDMIAKAQLDLDGCTIRADTTDPGGGFILCGEPSHFEPPDENVADIFDALRPL